MGRAYLDHKYIVRLYGEYLESGKRPSLDYFAAFLAERNPELGKLKRQTIHYILRNAPGGPELLAKRRALSLKDYKK